MPFSNETGVAADISRWTERLSKKTSQPEPHDRYTTEGAPVAPIFLGRDFLIQTFYVHSCGFGGASRFLSVWAHKSASIFLNGAISKCLQPTD